jgi:hypothetical protein
MTITSGFLVNIGLNDIPPFWFIFCKETVLFNKKEGNSLESEVPAYSRVEREGKVPTLVKFNQAIGAIPDTVKNWVFNTFVLLYYNQVLGLDARWVSIALAVAIIFDAITDPLVASISDNLRGKWGRRHPLMFLSAFPLGISIYCVFAPPAIEGMALFTWLMTFVLLTRGFMTLFFVPWAAITAELSDDYAERTSIMSYRYAIGWTIGVSLHRDLSQYRGVSCRSAESSWLLEFRDGGRHLDDQRDFAHYLVHTQRNPLSQTAHPGDSAVWAESNHWRIDRST